MLQENIKVTGKVLVQVFDKDGNVKEERKIDNLVVATGKSFIAASMLKTTTDSPAAMSHMAIGTNNGAAQASDSSLLSEIGRVSLTSATNSGAVTTYTATFPAGTGTGGIVEAGILNGSTSGTLLCRTVFPVVNKGADDSMSITWAVTVS